MGTLTNGNELAEQVHQHSERLYMELLGSDYKEESGEWWWRAPYRPDRDPSLRVNPQTWLWVDDTNTDDYGGDIITLAALIWKMDSKKDFVEICTSLLHLIGEDVHETNGHKNGKKPKFFQDGNRLIQMAALSPEIDRDEFAASYGLEWSDFAEEGYNWSTQSFQSTGWQDVLCIQYPIHDFGQETLRSKWKSVQRRLDGDKKRLIRITPSGTKRRGIIGAPNLANCIGKTLVIAGGEEKQIAAVKAGFRAVCADTGEKRLSPDQISMIVAADAGDIIVCLDADGAGQKAALKICQDLFDRKAAPVIRIVKWPDGTKLKTDLNDVLKEHGLQAVKDLLNSAEIFHGAMFPDATPTIKSAPTDDEPKVTIQLGTDESRVIDQCVQVLSTRAGGSIFTRGGYLVRVKDSVLSPDGDALVSFAKVETMSRPAIRTLLTRMCTFVRYVEREDDWVPAHPPDWLAAGVDTTDDFQNIPALMSLSGAPVLRRDGTIFNGPGYDPLTAIFVTRDAITWDPPENAFSAEAIVEARETLCDLVHDFEFTSGASRSSWIACLLTLTARHIIEGPCPAFKVDANTPGSGKSLLLNLAGIIATGQPLAPSSKPPDDAEWYKFVTTEAKAGSAYVFMDNLKTGSAISSPHLEAVLTTGTWSGRLLGLNDKIVMPAMMIWLFSGNNVEVKGDLIRRVLTINIKTNSEHPELRDNFHIPNIIDHVKKNRRKYLGAALTILGGWIKAGRPRKKITPWGSYEAWSGTIRQAVIFAGLEDPCMYRFRQAEEGDNERSLIEWFADAIEHLDICKTGITTRRILVDGPEIADERIREGLLSAMASVASGKNMNVNVLGRALSRISGRIANRKSVEKEWRANQSVWTTVHHSDDDPTASGDDEGGLADDEQEELF